MSVTTVAAWVGAIAGTCAVVVDFYKYLRSGPCIKISARADCQISGVDEESDARKWIVVEVSNTGDRATTLLSLEAYGFKHPWQKLRPKAGYLFKNPSPTPEQEFPYRLEPGAIWTGFCRQESSKELVNSKHPYMVIVTVDGGHFAKLQKGRPASSK